MHRAPQASTIFCFITEAPGILTLKCENSKEVSINGLTMPASIPFDIRDQRTLLLFDGDIPWQGLSQSADVVYRRALAPLELSRYHLRKDHPFEEKRPHSIRIDHGRVMLYSYRIAILARTTKMMIRRYMKNGTPHYCFVEVRRNGENSEVTWHSTSY